MRTLLATIGLLLLLTGLAGAQRARTLADKDDSRSAVDIKSARGVHDRGNDRLAHLIRFHGPISPRNFRNAVQKHGPPGSVCVNIWTRRKPWEASPNYDVCVTADRNRARLLASVSRHGPKGGVRRIGNASAQLTTPRRLSIRFDPDLIRRPGRYRWSAHVTTFERGCTRRGCQDVAPRRGRSARTKLGAPAL